MDVIAINQQSNFVNVGTSDNVMHTLCSDHHGTPHAVCYGISRSMLKGGQNGGGIPIGENFQPSITANGCGAVCYEVYDARGNGDGEVSPTITGDHENRITDYTSVVIIDHSRRHDYQELGVIPTLEARMGTGGGQHADSTACFFQNTGRMARAGTGGNQLPLIVCGLVE